MCSEKFYSSHARDRKQTQSFLHAQNRKLATVQLDSTVAHIGGGRGNSPLKHGLTMYIVTLSSGRKGSSPLPSQRMPVNSITNSKFPVNNSMGNVHQLPVNDSFISTPWIRHDIPKVYRVGETSLYRISQRVTMS